MTARLAMAPPLFAQRQAFAAMRYWLHTRACPLVYCARAIAQGYRS